MSMEQEKRARDLVVDIAKEGKMTLNGCEYVLTNATHKSRLAVFAFFTKIMPYLAEANFDFINLPDWEKVNGILETLWVVDGFSISKLPNHWDEHPENWAKFVQLGMQVVAYPLLQGTL